MDFLSQIAFTLIYLVLIILSCELFTNAIEHLGDKLKLGKTATGSILTVIGTTMPETIVPLVVIFSAYILKSDITIGQNIALGGIFGSPFMLSSLSLFFLGIVLLLNKRKKLELDYSIVKRNYKYFLSAYFLVFISFFINKFLISVCLIILYIVFVYRTIIKSRKCYLCCELDELFFKKIFKKYNLAVIFLQILLSVFGLILFSHLFMDEIILISGLIKVNPLILSMIITPFATELPECTNSIIWTKQNKDDLAMANILGAIIFQSTILMVIGILLTKWSLEKDILLNMIFTLCSSLFILSNVIIKKRISYRALLICGLFYFGYFIVLFLR